MASVTDLGILPEEVEFGGVLSGTQDEGTRRSRQRNFGKVQHRKFTGYDQKLPMVIYGFREETVHGTSADGRPHSLVVFRWGLQQRKRGRRFKSARLRIVFATSRTKDSSSNSSRDASYDPHVVDVKPNGSYTLLPTPVTVARTRAIEGGVEGGFQYAKGTAKVTYELSSTTTATDQIVINGVERSGYDIATAKEVGDPDRCNIAEWQMFENTATRSGLPTFFRTAVLLERRKGDVANFTATFTIRAEVSNLTDAWTNLKRFVGLVPQDDPIIFDPSVEENGRLAVFKNKLDTAPLADECKFIMFKDDPGSDQKTSDEKDTEEFLEESSEESSEEDIDSSESGESIYEDASTTITRV
ncbi:hypothetical protein F4781DRAFT_382789 [Annulohypoxylon bovei var. microspora]|nr:hypothetical protein F4781DRAFT_382789 [Annulohypoxylon bovei var. microspora]